MQTPNFLRTFGRKCMFSTGLSKVYPECSVESYQQKHTFGDLSNFLHVFGLSVKKMRTVGEKASQELQMRNLCIWMIFLRKTTLVVRKSFSSIFELSEKKVRELDQKIPAVFSKENSTFPAKNFARKLFFREYYVFFSLFFDIELSVLHLFAEALLYESQNFDLKTQPKGLWENLFFIKLCSFVFPSDFCRHRISFGLSAKLSDRVVEAVFRVFSGALSAKRHFFIWRKSFARASNEKPMYLDDCSRKTTLVVRKTLSCIFEPSVKKVWEIDEIISAVVFEKVFTFPEKNFARKFFFVKIMFFFSIFFRHWVICSPFLCWNFAAGISKNWSGNPTKIFVGKTFF